MESEIEILGEEELGEAQYAENTRASKNFLNNFFMGSATSYEPPITELISNRITQQHLNFVAHELGLIKLCWDEVNISDVFRTHFPCRYSSNTEKEKILLWYAENFRKQFVYKYPHRRPILLACDNECGLQKMVCTTIRPTTMKYPEFQTWQGCASFVADHLMYEILDNPTVLIDFPRG